MPERPWKGANPAKRGLGLATRISFRGKNALGELPVASVASNWTRQRADWPDSGCMHFDSGWVQFDSFVIQIDSGRIHFGLGLQQRCA